MVVDIEPDLALAKAIIELRAAAASPKAALAYVQAKLTEAEGAFKAHVAQPHPVAPIVERGPVGNGEVTLRDRIRGLMADRAKRSTLEVAEALAVPQDKVGDGMKRLTDLGELRRVSTGVYVLAGKVPSGRNVAGRGSAKGTRPPSMR